LHGRFLVASATPALLKTRLDVRRRFAGRADLVRVGHVDPQQHDALVTHSARRRSASGLRAVA
jgi:hypothetical protein